MNKYNSLSDLSKLLLDSAMAPYTDMLPLKAIHFSRPIRISTGKTHRISVGDRVNVIDGYLADVTELPSHEIVSLTGTMADTKKCITLSSLKDGSITEIHLTD